MPRQLGQVAVVDPHVTIDVKPQARGLLDFVLADPLFGQDRVPLRCPSLLATQKFQFLAQRAYFRNPVQSQQISPLPRRRVAQLLDGTDARQCHQRQQHKHAAQAIEAFGQLVEFAVAQQSNRQQRWQGQQHTPLRNVPRRLEDNGRGF